MYVKFVATTCPLLPVLGLITQQFQGHSITEAVDRSQFQLCETHKFLICLEEFGGGGDEFASHYLQQVYMSAMFVAHDNSMEPIINMMSMPFIIKETTNRLYHIGIVTGNLLQWKIAVAAGLASDSPEFFKHIYNELIGMNLKLWPQQLRLT